MPVSKTAALEKRIEKLEQELSAYKRELSKQPPGANAAAHELAALRTTARRFFDTAESYGVNLRAFHPDVHAAALELLAATAPQPTKRTP